MHEVQMGLDSTGDSGMSTASLSLCESEQLEGGALKNAYISLHVSIEKERKQFGLTVERAVGLQIKTFSLFKSFAMKTSNNTHMDLHYLYFATYFRR